MQVKKKSGEDLEQRRPYYFQMGLVAALSLALVGFEWTQFEYNPIIAGDLKVNYEEEEEMIRIKIEVPELPKQPKPQKPTPKIKPVDKLIEPVEPTPEPIIDPDPEIQLAPLPYDDNEDGLEGEKEVPRVYVEIYPEFIGGEEAMYAFLGDNLKYPHDAKRQGIEGIVYTQFVVDKNGEISDVQVLRGIGGGCDEEAVRVIKKMPKWKPGIQEGRKVPVYFKMPIRFRLAK